MTKQERAAIAKLVGQMETLSVRGSRYETVDGKLTQTQKPLPPAEVDRLFASADYRLGWSECYKRFQETLDFILTANKQYLEKYADRHGK